MTPAAPLAILRLPHQTGSEFKMANTKIQETRILPASDGVVVQLHIADAPPDAEFASIRVDLMVKLPRYELPLVAHLQREAMTHVQKALTLLQQQLGQEIQDHPRYDLTPKTVS
jgi:hypothetical protein